MDNEILSYLEMCQREGASLQKGMNFGLGGNYSVVLASVRQNSPYNDRFEDDGSTLVYEGHNKSRSQGYPDPKTIDQPEYFSSGGLTQNGKFHAAASEFKSGLRDPENVRVYEKLQTGIWSYNGYLHLVDSWREKVSGRSVFKFKLSAATEEQSNDETRVSPQRRRLIPTSVKRKVWKRDHGRCVECGSSDELHFDHIIPFSKGGTSITSENVQILCARQSQSAQRG